MKKQPRVLFCQPSPADGYAYDPTPDPDSAAAHLALCLEELQAAIDHLTLAIKDDPALDETLDIEREWLRKARTGIEQAAKDAQA